VKRLERLHAAPNLATLTNLRGNRLERLKGGRQGQYSICIIEQWRVCFSWDEGADQRGNCRLSSMKKGAYYG